MPVHKCPNGKYRIGSGKCMYDSKAKAEAAYKGYLAKKHEIENLKYDITLKLEDLKMMNKKLEKVKKQILKVEKEKKVSKTTAEFRKKQEDELANQ